MTERYRRTDFGHLQIGVTYTDPAAYVKPWGFTANMTLQPDTDMLENICERSSDHWAGSLSDAAGRSGHRPARHPLVPHSQTLFEGLGLGYQFLVDDTAAVTDLVEVHLSGPYRYARQR